VAVEVVIEGPRLVSVEDNSGGIIDVLDLFSAESLVGRDDRR
jgi:hypothetical protein